MKAFKEPEEERQPYSEPEDPVREEPFVERGLLLFPQNSQRYLRLQQIG